MVRFPLIAREGWLWISATGLLAMVLQNSAPFYVAALGWLTLFFVIWVFRDPPRNIPLARCGVVSPINGHVTAVDSVRDPCMDRDTRHLRLRMGWLDVMSLFSPSEAKILRQTRPPARLEPQSQTWPHACIYLETDDGDILLIMISALHPFSRFSCYTHIGERVGKGQRCGFCFFACQVDIYLPEHARVNVKPGDRVQAGTSLLAELHRPVANPGLLSSALA